MSRRRKQTELCTGCHLDTESCLCAMIKSKQMHSQLALVMHHREYKKASSSGPLALALLSPSQLYLYGQKGVSLDLNHLSEQGRRVLLLVPTEEAALLSAELVAADPRPITLVVVDGNWRQTSRAAHRIPGLERAEQISLGPSASESALHRIAQCLGVIESRVLQAQLEQIDSERLRREAQRASSVQQVRSGSESATPELGLPGSTAARLTLLYEDEDLVCINKPSGMLVHRGWAKDGVPALQLLRDQLGQRLYPVHRLDRATSGALLFAKKSAVVREMQALFQADRVAKRYLALCRGTDPELRWVDHPLSKQADDGEKRPAQTEFRFLGSQGRYGLYEARPKTGRAHQIRRHLKHVSHPIIGDVRYGKGEHNRHFREEYNFHRLALHCAELCFTQPRSGESLQIVAELPDDFRAVLQKLGLRDDG